LAKKFLEYLELKQEQKLRESIRNIIKRLIWEERKTLGRKDLKTMQ
jgi:hypothetical protein